MNEPTKLRETLSALMDGEVHELELQRILKDPLPSEELDCLRRYQAVSAVLSGHRHIANLDVSARVASAIAGETAASPHSISQATPWRLLGGIAVAASVAFAVVFSAQLLRGPSTETVPTVAVASPSMQAPTQPVEFGQPAQVAMASQNFEDTGLNQAQLDSEYQRRLNAYLLRHAEHAAMNNGQGMIPFARLAGYETAPNAQR